MGVFKNGLNIFIFFLYGFLNEIFYLSLSIEKLKEQFGFGDLIKMEEGSNGVDLNNFDNDSSDVFY